MHSLSSKNVYESHLPQSRMVHHGGPIHSNDNKKDAYLLSLNDHQKIGVSPGLYFALSGRVYQSGDSAFITDIGVALLVPNNADPGSSLVCNTSNIDTNCCRRSDGGNVGEWYFLVVT